MIRTLDDILGQRLPTQISPRTAKIAMSAGLIASLGIFAMKWDITRIYFDVSERIEAIEEQQQEMQENSIIYVQPCYRQAGEHVYEVRGC